jgi:hypothetical protein
LGLLATAHRSDEKTGLDARLDPEWHPVWSGSSLAKDAAASMAGLSTGPRTSKVRRASQQRSAGGRPSGELILGARTARKFCVRDAWRRSLLERPIVKALEHLPVVLTMSENLAEKIAARTGVDPAKVVEVVQLALEELHRLTVVGDKGPTDAAMETCFSGEAAFTLHRCLSDGEPHDGRVNEARTWSEVAIRFITQLP